MDSSALYRRIAESFERQSLLKTLGASLARVSDGQVDITLPFADALRQQHGFLHAGAVATIADSACGYACLTKMPEGSAILSVEFKINLLAPAIGERFIARGAAVRVGRTIAVATAQVSACSPDETETVIAIMQATMMRVEPRAGAAG
jgi:uncharacterized protein (TIGR00369 family)